MCYLVRKVETVEVVRQNLHLVDEGPETHRLLPEAGHLPLPLSVTQEGPEAAGQAVVGQGDQQLLSELKTAGELIVHLEQEGSQNIEVGVDVIVEVADGGSEAPSGGSGGNGNGRSGCNSGGWR